LYSLQPGWSICCQKEEDMKRICVLALLALFLASSVPPAAAITWGELDYEGHPNVGIMVAYINGERVWRCTGTLISDRVFLTAGHCLEDGVDLVKVWFDSDMTANPGYDGGLAGVPILHPSYSWGGSNPHDVGVVILDDPVEGIQPALLPAPDLLAQLRRDRILRPGGPEGAKFIVVGYGGTLSWPPPEVDYSSRIRRFALSEYVALTQSWLHMSQNILKGDGGTCGGDSGGPAFWIDPQGNEILVAVTSWGDPYCISTGFNYRIDVPEILDWIYSQYP
jgi:hypothetical protein